MNERTMEKARTVVHRLSEWYFAEGGDNDPDSPIDREDLDALHELVLRTPRGEGEAAAMSANLARALAAMQAAWIEWRRGRGADAAMQWIENTLIGPGLIPGDDESDAQAFFDRAIAEIENHQIRHAAALRPEAQGEEDAVRRTWERAVQRAYGCLDYCGGYRGAELTAFHSGIKTVIRALEAGLDTVDTQTAALDRIGAARRGEGGGDGG